MGEGVQRYLARHAHLPDHLDELADRLPQVEHALVVPLRAEAPSFAEGLRAVPDATVVVVVVNGRQDDPDPIGHANRELLQQLAGTVDVPPIVAGDLAGRPLVVIDRASPGRRLGRRHGVGHARRAGFDLALWLWAAGKVRSPWISTTDADATLPADHFDARSMGGARTHRVWHTPTGHPQIDAATALYETWLRYYAAGLAHAHSPFALLPVGSAMAIHADAYAAVRGMPLRAAAEDFYLLHKVAKLGQRGVVVTPPTGRVRIRGRESSRVPFGTGRTTSAWLGHLDEVTFLDPRGFDALDEVLVVLEQEATEPGAWRGLPEASCEALVALGFADLTDRLTGPPARRFRALHEWFDGFRSMRFLHHLRDACLPALPWRQALAEAPFVPPHDPDEPHLVTLRHQLEETLPPLAGLAAMGSKLL